MRFGAGVVVRLPVLVGGALVLIWRAAIRTELVRKERGIVGGRLTRPCKHWLSEGYVRLVRG